MLEVCNILDEFVN